MQLLIVDDHPIVVSGVRSLLERDGDINVLEANGAEAALELARSTELDVAIIDVNLPGMSGFALARQLLDRSSDARIIMFSMNDDPVFIAQAMEIGARGYISKNGNPADMVSAIRRVAEGGSSWPDGLEQRIQFLLEERGGRGAIKLTPREQDILRLLSSGQSLSEIAEKVGVSYKTIAQTCAQMRSRVGARTQAELVRIALERKLV